MFDRSDIELELEGVQIKKIYEEANLVMDLHTTLTSARGNYFRRTLLHNLSSGVSKDELKLLSEESNLEEYVRHLNKLMKFKLVRAPSDGDDKYIRTELGERSVNAIRGLERGIGENMAKKIFEASLGPISLRAFLRIYGQKKDFEFTLKEGKYSVLEVAKLFAFIRRGIDRVSAMDKLDDAGLFEFRDDEFIYFEPRKAREFYRYLCVLYSVIEEASMKAPVSDVDAI